MNKPTCRRRIDGVGFIVLMLSDSRRSYANDCAFVNLNISKVYTKRRKKKNTKFNTYPRLVVSFLCPLLRFRFSFFPWLAFPLTRRLPFILLLAKVLVNTSQGVNFKLDFFDEFDVYRMDVLVFEFHVRMKDKRTKNNSIERPKGAMHSCTGGAFCCFTFLQKGVK